MFTLGSNTPGIKTLYYYYYYYYYYYCYYFSSTLFDILRSQELQYALHTIIVVTVIIMIIIIKVTNTVRLHPVY